MNETPIAQALHDCYVRRSGLAVPFTMERLYAWNVWRSRGFTEGDLEAVIAIVKRKIAAGQKWDGSLGFKALIENISHFEEMLAEARAWARKPKVNSARASVLRATFRPVEEPKSNAQTSGDVLAAAKAFEAFRAWRAPRALWRRNHQS